MMDDDGTKVIRFLKDHSLAMNALLFNIEGNPTLHDKWFNEHGFTNADGTIDKKVVREKLANNDLQDIFSPTSAAFRRLIHRFINE